jgi:hypothetical protein
MRHAEFCCYFEGSKVAGLRAEGHAEGRLAEYGRRVKNTLMKLMFSEFTRIFEKDFCITRLNI